MLKLKDLDLAGSFIHQVDCLVGKEPVLHVTVRQLYGRFDRFVGDTDLMELFVAFAKSFQDLDRVFRHRLFHADRLEAALHGRVLFDVLLVLGVGRRADQLDVDRGDDRLEHRSHVHGAGRVAQADHRVDFVDEQDDLFVGGHFVQELLEAPFELAAGSSSDRSIQLVE